MIDHLDDLLDVGLSSLKIEGRAKSAYYAAIVTGAYRHCLDDAAAGRPIDPVWRDEVEHVSHRPYATGFYYGYPGQYYENSRYIREWQVVALVTECDCRRQRCHFPAEQVPHRGHGGAGRAGPASLFHDGPGDAG